MEKKVDSGKVVIVGITKADGTEYEPKNWRVDGIGRSGLLMILEPEDLSFGNLFARFADDTGFCSFRTGCGKIHIDGTYIILTTKNSIYAFVEVDDERWPGADWIEEQVALYREYRGLEPIVPEEDAELEKMMRENFEKYVLQKE